MKILVAVDGSVVSLDAVRHALKLQHAGLKADFVLVNIQEPSSLYEMVMAPDAQALHGIAVGAGQHALEAAEALFKSAGVDFEHEIGSGDPAPALIDIAENHQCDLIILGGSKQGALRSVLLGSVSEEVLKRSPVPVVVVKHPEADSD